MSDKRIWEILNLLFIKEEPEDEIRKARSLDTILRALEEPAQKRPVRRMGRRFRVVIAAAAVVCFLAAGLGWLYHEHRGGSVIAGAFDIIDTRARSRTYITLPDSSTVVLNGACRFEYNKQFGVSSREMILRGEAWFDIRKNPDMPLMLTAGNVRIKVLGTSFNVKAYADDAFVEATLLKGVIEVSVKTDPDRAILLRPGEKIVIRQQDTLSTVDPVKRPAVRAAAPRDLLAVTKVDVDPKDSSMIETAWLKDRMVFRKESFESLAKRMERWYNVRIIFTDPEVCNLIFTGSFEKEDIGQALRALRNSASFNYRINDGVVKISSH